MATTALKPLLHLATGHLFPWVGVIVLNYHRVVERRESLLDQGLWSADIESFDEQIRWLKAHFDLISPREISYVLRVKRGRHVLVTFDDGFRDNYTIAFPILHAHRVPATFFVTTGFIDRPRLPWWDQIAWMVRASTRETIHLPRYLVEPISLGDPGDPDREQAVRVLLRTYKALPACETDGFLDGVAEATGCGHPEDSSLASELWMTWDMLREMRAGGMTIGGHTVSHQILSRMSPQEQWEEIAGCGKRLEEELGVPMRTFSYPVGHRDSFNADTRKCLERAGVSSAFSYYGGFRELSAWDPYDVPRIAVERDMRFLDFRGCALAPRWTT